MNIATIILLAIVVIGLLILFYGIGIFNNLVKLRNRFKNAYAQIDVQLKRRYDLIPNLVETARVYMQHERETLTAVIEARNIAVKAGNAAASKPGDPQAMQQLLGAEGALTGALGKLFALSESYPELKADQNMQQLSEELTSTENKIAFARQGYNDAVMIFNTSREQFPNNIIANSFGFNEAELYQITNDEEKESIKISFN
ncbi:MAG: LemA family protein [Deltaproteobacteria bacterium]|nr:LemA family protein [Deltaproteobacteria bacterium]